MKTRYKHRHKNKVNNKNKNSTKKIPGNPNVFYWTNDVLSTVSSQYGDIAVMHSTLLEAAQYQISTRNSRNAAEGIAISYSLDYVDPVTNDSHVTAHGNWVEGDKSVWRIGRIENSGGLPFVLRKTSSYGMWAYFEQIFI